MSNKFVLVRNHKLYLTTESGTAGVLTSSTGLYSTSPGSIAAGTGVGKRGGIPLLGEVEAHLVPGVVSFELNLDREDIDTGTISGIYMSDNIPIRKTGTITLNKRKSCDTLARISDKGRAGVNGTTSSMEAMDWDYVGGNPDYGYRIVLFDGNTYTELYHCEMTSYGASPGNEKNTELVEIVTFRFFDYEVGLAEGAVGAQKVVA